MVKSFDIDIISSEFLQINVQIEAVAAPGDGMGGNYPPLLSKHGLHISSKNRLKSTR